MSTPISLPAAFPGGTAVSRLRVYTDVSVDGLAGGTPHLHTVSTEGYVVVSGSGVLHTLTMSGFQETPLEAGSVVWFTPGTIHRAVNTGDLNVLVVMQNAGLPEAGDAVMTFPDEHLVSAEAYRDAARLPALPSSEAERAEAASARRDRGVSGFLELKAAAVNGNFAPLERFHERAVRIVRDLVPDWRARWDAGVGSETRATDAALQALESGLAPHLRAAAVRLAPAIAGAAQPEAFGMCGRLSTWDLTPAATTTTTTPTNI